MVKLGEKVTDSITGFSGIAVARTEYLYGCVRITVEPTQLSEGKPIEPCHFDEQRLTGESAAATGGPGVVPPERKVPKH